MPFETTLTVPTRHVRELMARLSSAGFTVLDTGERVLTDEGADAEATLRLAHFEEPQAQAALPQGLWR